MLQAYRTTKPNETSLLLAGKITELVLASGVTYVEAEDALEAAQEMLMKQTRPVSAQTPQQAGSEPNA